MAEEATPTRRSARATSGIFAFVKAFLLSTLRRQNGTAHAPAFPTAKLVIT